jgi:hypothetical protein
MHVFLGPRFRGDERGESPPDHQPFVPAKAGTQCTKIDPEKLKDEHT